ncbi:tRNA (adenosine(37)-N6)-threonylcarbamoyltransferase complex dimerization subunit type 1 TsaB [Evansella sp. AB-rgal1]|uniref:tRNA (adenosine(37)-N6)-threonylcarbamoyltransferase complex dimerization subunit type 1 TsaB n=1 Tax=Evansella sp. AB-rgal1 TaxID=3242696 RepID=UPI00359EE889
MNGLAIDTSTFVMGVGVIKDGILVGECITNINKNHSLRLMPAIRNLLEEVEISPSELDRIIVSEGPGSYTGVRIGVTTAKTLAWSLGIPIVGVSSLEVLAHNGRYFGGLISPFIDARRGQVYTGLYRWSNGRIECVKEDQIIQHSDWLSMLQNMDEEVLFLSADMDKHEEIITSALSKKAVIGNATELVPRPGELAFIGTQKEIEMETHEFHPNYIRLAEAETNWLAAKRGEESKNKGE